MAKSDQSPLCSRKATHRRTGGKEIRVGSLQVGIRAITVLGRGFKEEARLSRLIGLEEC